MGLKLNKFSSRVLDVRHHSLLEGIAVQIFFLLILYALITEGYKSNVGQLVYLYLGATAVICIVLLIDLYYILSNLVSKNDDSEKY